MCRSAAAFCTAATAAPIVAPGARLKLSVTDGNWPWWLITAGIVPVSIVASWLSGTAVLSCDADVDPLQGVRARAGSAGRPPG